MDKPTLRTLHGTFTQPVHLYHDLVPANQGQDVPAGKSSPNRLRGSLRSFALTAISLQHYLRASRTPRPKTLRYQEPV